MAEKKENPLVSVMKVQAVENNTFMIAIMMLVARETERDPKFPDWMRAGWTALWLRALESLQPTTS